MKAPPPGGCERVAFYDFDGTLAAGNVVTRYAWFAKRCPRRTEAAWRYAKAFLGVPLWLLLDRVSRRLFNIVFFRQYRGLEEGWLRAQAGSLLETAIKGEQFAHARERVALDRAAGFRAVLVTGGLDFALAPAADYFGFDDMLANRMSFRDGVATGEILPPLLAGAEKEAALRRYAAERGYDMREARAYSDSASDLPMLRAVGRPVATNPDSRLRKEAAARGWEIIDLNRSPHAEDGRPPAPSGDPGAAQRLDSLQR